MITVRIQEKIKRRGFKNAYQFGLQAKLPTAVAARLYKNQVTAINLDTLDKLCKTLDCTPGELFKFDDEVVA